jgi:hypothetical protein
VPLVYGQEKALASIHGALQLVWPAAEERHRQRVRLVGVLDLCFLLRSPQTVQSTQPIVQRAARCSDGLQRDEQRRARCGRNERTEGRIPVRGTTVGIARSKKVRCSRSKNGTRGAKQFAN